MDKNFKRRCLIVLFVCILIGTAIVGVGLIAAVFQEWRDFWCCMGVGVMIDGPCGMLYAALYDKNNEEV